MALTPQEVEKINGLFKQIDDLQSTVKTKDQQLQEKDILIGKTRVSLNEKQSIIAQRDAEIKKLIAIIDEKEEKIVDHDTLKSQIQLVSDKVDKLIASVSATKPVSRSTKTVKKK